MRKLQTLQNTVLRLQTGLAKGTATEYLMDQSGQLSVHQLSAYFSILQVHKCKMSKQPHYLYNRLFPGGDIIQDEMRLMRSIPNEHINISCDLTLTRNGFFYRASKLYNALPAGVKDTLALPSFKKLVKAWIKQNVTVRP